MKYPTMKFVFDRKNIATKEKKRDFHYGNIIRFDYIAKLILTLQLAKQDLRKITLVTAFLKTTKKLKRFCSYNNEH